MAHSPATNDASHEFNKYRLREPISDSFLGTRYRAVSNTAGKRSAASKAFGSDISALRSSAFALRLLRAQSAHLIDRVARAAKAVRYLDHPNVLAPIQLIRAQTRLGVITQDVDGYTLSDVLRLASQRGEALPQAIALRITLDALDGVVALHATEAGAQRFSFACGGLTPDSIHIGKDGCTRLIDPGVAGAAAGVAYWGHDPVALAYTAPEQSGAEPSFTPCSDAFSIGAMLWEMLAGRSLFGAPTAAETLEHLHRSDIPRVQRQHFARGEPIVASVAHVVALALQRDPSVRYADCVDLAAALREAASHSSQAEVAEYCRRLAGSTVAGAFADSAPPRQRSISGAPDFELPSGAISLSVPPSPRDAARPLPSEPADVAADLFEPQTAKLQPLPLEPAPPRRRSPTAPPPVGPITAFPISDFVPIHPETRRRNYAPLAVAATVLLGLSYLVWHATGSSSRDDPSSRAAAAERSDEPSVPPTIVEAAAPPAIATAASAPAPFAPLVTVTIDPTAPVPLPPPPAADSASSYPASVTVTAKREGASRRRLSKTDKPDSPEQDAPPPAPVSSAPNGTFIPDDL